jgi:hypothetical protein
LSKLAVTICRVPKGDVDKENPHQDEVDLADNVMLILRSLELSNAVAPKSPYLARQLSVFGDAELDGEHRDNNLYWFGPPE